MPWGPWEGRSPECPRLPRSPRGTQGRFFTRVPSQGSPGKVNQEGSQERLITREPSLFHCCRFLPPLEPLLCSFPPCKLAPSHDKCCFLVFLVGETQACDVKVKVTTLTNLNKKGSHQFTNQQSPMSVKRFSLIHQSTNVNNVRKKFFHQCHN